MRNAYRVIHEGQQLGIGVSGSKYLHINSIAKQNTSAAPYCIPNEYICGMIGRFLGLPVPPVAIVRSKSAGPWIASLDFNVEEDNFPPVTPSECVSKLPHESTGLLLFDILIANSDRHAGNLSIDTSGQPATLQIYDHSHALLGNQSDKGTDRLNALRDRMGITAGMVTAGNRHCLLDSLTNDDYIEDWRERIAVLPDFLFDDVCKEVIGMGISSQEATVVIDFLRHRRDNLRSIIDANQNEFKGISQWRLMP